MKKNKFKYDVLRSVQVSSDLHVLQGASNVQPKLPHKACNFHKLHKFEIEN